MRSALAVLLGNPLMNGLDGVVILIFAAFLFSSFYDRREWRMGPGGDWCINLAGMEMVGAEEVGGGLHLCTNEIP